MKALVILRTILEDEEYEGMECVPIGFTKTFLEKSIAELEALKYNYEAQEIIIRDKTALIEAMAQPKTCDGFEYQNCKNSTLVDIYCNNCMRNYTDYYEPKEEK